MKAKRRLVSLVLVMLLLFSLSMGVFAGADGGPTRPQFRTYIEDPSKP